MDRRRNVENDRLHRMRPLASLLTSTSGGALLSGLFGHGRESLVFLGLGLLATGLAHGLRAATHLADPRRRLDRRLRRIAWTDARTAALTILGGALVAGGGVTMNDRPASLLALSLLGFAISAGATIRMLAVAAATVRERMGANIQDTTTRVANSHPVRRVRAGAALAPRLPLAQLIDLIAPTRRPPELSDWLQGTVALLCAICIGFMALGTAQGIAGMLEVLAADEPAQTTPSGRPAAPDPTIELTYAKLCPALPDPGNVGAGLGTLFARDGAVQAGCGETARRLPTGAWVARGTCSGALRSLAVGGVDGTTALLYGDAAQRAFDLAYAARSRLLAARVVHLDGGGDVVSLDTPEGTIVMTRATPALTPGSRRARRCEQVTEVARAHTTLPPPLAGAWAAYTQRHGLLWPEQTGPGRWIFLNPLTHAQAAAGDCMPNGTCTIGVGDKVLRARGGVHVDLAALPEAKP